MSEPSGLPPDADPGLSRLVAVADRWRSADPDPGTRAEIEQLCRRALAADGAPARAELVDRFAASLAFGTAGLRGAVGAGPNRMNRAVVIRAACGLAGYLGDVLAASGPDGRPPRVVVGHDARHGSSTFAEDSCAVLTAAGCEVLALPGALPTPVLAFAVRHLAADAGVMVTASHNPRQDNGYKVYLGGQASDEDGRGVQIVPPADRQIADRIEAAPAAIDVAMAPGGWTVLGPELVAAYLDAVCALVPGPPPSAPVSVVLTPMHGVGGELMATALERAGLGRPHLVAEQELPDPDFPTLPFPNPEEPGALDLALAAARERGADLVLANDPDADRCAIAVPDPAPGPGGRVAWRVLRGDEVGALLGELVLDRAPAQPGPGPVLARSVVSSELLQAIAADRGARCATTLTGFKWIARVPGLRYGYEEALGYCVAPQVVRDKDGISAGLLLVELANRLAGQGRTLLDALDTLALRHGVHATDQLSLRVQDLSRISQAMHRLRAEPLTELGGAPVTEWLDLAEGGVPDGLGATLPATDALALRTADGARVVVRPSGTEPKLKCYLEVVLAVPAGSGAQGLAAARAQAGQRLSAVRAQLEERLSALGAG